MRQGGYLAVGLAVGMLAAFRGASALPLGALLSATSILTGLTFAMALRFWERSIEARRDARYAADAASLTLIDRLKAHLLWTVIVGVASTFTLALTAIFGDVEQPVRWLTGLASGLVIYQIVLVAGALIEFYQAAYALKP